MDFDSGEAKALVEEPNSKIFNKIPYYMTVSLKKTTF